MTAETEGTWITPDIEVLTDKPEGSFSGRVGGFVLRLLQRKPTRGLALSGGGARGDFELGVVRYLYEGRNWFPEIIAGTSVGAINAAKLAESGKGKYECLDALASLDQIWYELEWNDHMFLKQPWLQALERSGVGFLLQNVTSGQISQIDAFASLLLPGGVDTRAAIEAIQRGMASTSMYNLDPIKRRLIPRPDGLGFDVVALKLSSMKVLFATVSLETGEVSYFDNDGRVIYGAALGGPPVGLAEVIIASASIPTVFPPVVLNAQSFVDGGVRDLLPIDGLVAAGAREIIGVEASVHTPYKAAPGGKWELAEIAERTINDLLTDEIVRSEAYPRVTEPGLDVTIVRPRVDIHDTMTIDAGLIQIALHYGYMCAFDEFEAAKTVGTDDQRYNALTTLADAITVERMQNWKQEYRVFYGLPPFLPIDGEHGVGVFENRWDWVRWMIFQQRVNGVAGTLQPGTKFGVRYDKPVVDKTELLRLRDGKRRVAELVRRRKQAAAELTPDPRRPECVPPARPWGSPPGHEKGAVAWWTDWERHPWKNYKDYAGPWAEIGPVPAEAPPAP